MTTRNNAILNFPSPIVYVWHKIANEIEDIFKKSLNCEKLNYTYCEWHQKSNDGKDVWLGNVGLLEAMRLSILASLDGASIDLAVTSAEKGHVVDYADVEKQIELEVWGPDGIPELNAEECLIKQENGMFQLNFPKDFYEKACECADREAELVNIDYFLETTGVKVMAGDELTSWLWDSMSNEYIKRSEENRKDHRFQWIKKRPIRNVQFLDNWYSGFLTKKTHIEETLNELKRMMYGEEV